MKVRQLGSDDFETLRAIRLRALRDAPDAYGSMYEETAALAEADWRSSFDNVTVFLAEGASGAATGLVRTYRDPDDRSVAYLISMWVAPEARGTGVGDALVQRVLSFAASDGAATVRLHVVDGNVMAIRLYERNRFRLTGTHVVRERDGAIEHEMERAP